MFSDDVTRISIQVLEDMIGKFAEKFREEDWNLIFEVFKEIFDNTYPEIVINFLYDINLLTGLVGCLRWKEFEGNIK